MDFNQRRAAAQLTRLRVRVAAAERAKVTQPLAGDIYEITPPMFAAESLVDDKWFLADQKGQAQDLSVEGYDGAAQFPSFEDLIYIERKRTVEATDHYISLGDPQSVAGPVNFPVAVQVPAAYMNDEGGFDFRFRVASHNGTESVSSATSVILDWTAPIPTQETVEAIIFPFDPEDFLLTPECLSELPAEGLTVEIPAYPGWDARDEIVWAWNAGMPGLPDIPEERLHIESVPADFKISIPADVIVAAGDTDGRCYFAYTLRDQSHNYSRISKAVPVKVIFTKQPGPVEPPQVPLADPVVDLVDAQEPVNVEIPTLVDFFYNDQIVVTWGDTELPAIPIGSDPNFPLQVPVTKAALRAAYPADASGVRSTRVSYQVFRGYNSWPSSVINVAVDLSVIGPEYPEWPEPVNPRLPKPTLISANGEVNELVDSANVGQAARIDIVLFDTPSEDDVIQVYWNSSPAGAPYSVKATDTAGSTIALSLPWDAILAAGNATAMPLSYSIRAQAGINEVWSQNTDVVVQLIPVQLDAPQFPQLADPDGFINCNVANMDRGRIHVLIPPSAGYVEDGVALTVYWEGYRSAADGMTLGDAVEATNWSGALTWSATNNKVYVEPAAIRMDVHPAPDPIPFGFCKCYYTINVAGREITSDAKINRVSLATPGGLCQIDLS